MRPIIGVVHGILAALVGAAPSSADTVSESKKFVAKDGAPQALLGLSVAVHGGTSIAGAPGATTSGPMSGAAYLVDVDTGGLLGKLTAPGGESGDFFGAAVAISSDVAVVGAAHDDELGPDSGAAYVFEARTAAVLRKLVAADGAAFDEFGGAVAASRTRVLVGAERDDDHGEQSGAAYVFDALSGTQIAKLTDPHGTPGDRFGAAVDLDRNRALVGAMFDDAWGTAAGGAVLFDATTGEVVARLLPAGLAAGDRFGAAVALSGPYAVVGAPGRDDAHADDVGAAYVFDVASGALVHELRPLDSAPGDGFGHRVAIDGTTIAVGCSDDDDNGDDSGSAYVFDATTGTQLAKLLPSDGSPGDSFGISIAVHGEAVVVGAVLDTEYGLGTGSTYHFEHRVATYGAGCPGGGGATPNLLMHGDPSPGAQVALTLDHGLGGALSVTFVGPEPDAAPLGGGCTAWIALPAAALVVPLGGAGPAAGSFTLPGYIPPDAPLETLRFQSFVLDPASELGLAASNGLRVRID